MVKIADEPVKLRRNTFYEVSDYKNYKIMKTLIQKINQRKNQIEILEKSKKSTLAELHNNSVDVGLNLHCQMVENITNDLMNHAFLSNVDVIFISDRHHQYNLAVADAFYKILENQISEIGPDFPAIESSEYFTDYIGLNQLFISISFDHYVVNDWGVKLSLRMGSTYNNESMMTNDSYEAYKSNEEFLTEGHNPVQFDKLVKDVNTLQEFNIVKKDIIIDILDTCKDLGHEQRDNDSLYKSTNNTFDKAINNLNTEIDNLIDDYLTSMVGQSIDGGDICSGLWKNQDDNISNVYKLDIIKETPKCFRVNVHVCHTNGGYVDNAGNEVPRKRIEYVPWEDIILPKGDVKNWFKSILYGVQNLDQIKTYNEVRKFKNLKSIQKIYDSGKVDKLYSNKQFQSLYNSLNNMYVDISFKYITNDQEVSLSRGCIWENAHKWDTPFESALNNYNPDNN